MLPRIYIHHQTMPMTKEAMDIRTQRIKIHIRPTMDLIKGLMAIPVRLMNPATATDQRIMAIQVDHI